MDGTIYVSKKDDNGYDDDYDVYMKRREMEDTEQTGLLRYYDIGFGEGQEEQYKQLESDIPPLIQSEFFVNNISEEEDEEV